MRALTKYNYLNFKPYRYVPDAGMGGGVEDDKGQRGKGRRGGSPNLELIERTAALRGKGGKKMINVDSKTVNSQR